MKEKAIDRHPRRRRGAGLSHGDGGAARCACSAASCGTGTGPWTATINRTRVGADENSGRSRSSAAGVRVSRARNVAAVSPPQIDDTDCNRRKATGDAAIVTATRQRGQTRPRWRRPKRKQKTRSGDRKCLRRKPEQVREVITEFSCTGFGACALGDIVVVASGLPMPPALKMNSKEYTGAVPPQRDSYDEAAARRIRADNKVAD